MPTLLIVLLWILALGLSLMVTGLVISLAIARKVLKDHWVKTQFR